MVKKPVTCNHCGATGLYFVWVQSRYLLCKGDAIHNCKYEDIQVYKKLKKKGKIK